MMEFCCDSWSYVMFWADMSMCTLVEPQPTHTSSASRALNSMERSQTGQVMASSRSRIARVGRVWAASTHPSTSARYCWYTKLRFDLPVTVKNESMLLPARLPSPPHAVPPVYSRMKGTVSRMYSASASDTVPPSPRARASSRTRSSYRLSSVVMGGETRVSLEQP